MNKLPFPYFGGKSSVAAEVWKRFGDVPNYVEPFAGGLAVLLKRPASHLRKPRTETINELNPYIANFWRASSVAPEEVARWADWPVNETDQHARHHWLLKQDEFKARMATDPDYFDPKIAGWWVWGQCCWIGSGWCSEASEKMPHLGNAGQGIHRASNNAGLYTYFEELRDRLRNVRVICGDWQRVMGGSVTHKHGITGVFLDPPYLGHEHLYTPESGVTLDVLKWCEENGSNPLLRIALCGYSGKFDPPAGWTEYRWKAKGGFQSFDNGNPEKERVWFSPACIQIEQQASLFEASHD